MPDVNQVDIAFVVDTTGSMGGFLNSAKRQMRDMIRAVNTMGLDLHYVLADYRDHPPEEHSYVAQLQTGSAPVPYDRFDAALSGLGLGGGGDLPEAVLDGLNLLGDVQWRPHSRRLAFLVGDAPAHGYTKGGQHDRWPGGCPDGLTAESVSARLEQHGILLNGIVVNGSMDAVECFGEFCAYTGGAVVTGDGMRYLRELLESEFGYVDFDTQVLSVVEADPEWTFDSLARSLSRPTSDVSASVRRLLRRDLIQPAA